jgi:cytochrome bd-type quinol oxidase subunit 1
MRTRDAVTPATGVQGTFALFTLLYLALGVVVAVMIRDLTRAAPSEAT